MVIGEVRPPSTAQVPGVDEPEDSYVLGGTGVALSAVTIYDRSA